METSTHITHRFTPSGSCDPREQGTALVGLGVALLLVVGTVIAAVAMGGEGVAPTESQGSSTAGLGGGAGGGIGSGVGAGGGASGDGPGGGAAGTGKGAANTGSGGMPKGSATGAVAGGAVTKSTSLVAGEVREAPKWGFTVPDKDTPVDPPTGASAVGLNNGTGGAGRAGAGGGGKQVPQFMGVETKAKSIVFVLDFSSSMDMPPEKEEALKSELSKGLHTLPPDCKFQVVLFGLSPRTGAKGVELPYGGMAWTNSIPLEPRGQWLMATEQNKAKAIHWVMSRHPDPESGSDAWDSVRLAISMGPEAIFLLTDGGELDFAHIEDELKRGDPDGLTQVNTLAFAVDYDVGPLRELAARHGGSYRRVLLTPDKP